VITGPDFNAVLVEALPELAADRLAYERRRIEDAEFVQSFFSYSFVPTLQAAIDQNVEDFCMRAFAMIERLVHEGNPEVQAILRDEFFDYGPVCEKWMKRAEWRMGELTRKAAQGREP
jgi:hypothetical protein